MGDRGWKNGMFVWRELMTDDAEGATRFYAELFGWSWKGEDMGPAGTYWLASHRAQQLAGLMRKPPGMAAPPAWTSYALVDDVDAAAQRCGAAGGDVLRAPDDIPDVGRFAVIADPFGAVIQLFRSFTPDAETPPTPGPGTFCWETLVTPDPAAAATFYGRVVGVASAPAPNGQGTVFTAGGDPVADVQEARRGEPSYWATYVQVEDAERSRDLAARLGGRIVVPRIDVPQIGTVAVIADPSGATLGLFQPG